MLTSNNPARRTADYTRAAHTRFRVLALRGSLNFDTPILAYFCRKVDRRNCFRLQPLTKYYILFSKIWPLTCVGLAMSFPKQVSESKSDVVGPSTGDSSLCNRLEIQLYSDVKAAMKEFPEMFRVWVTKQVSHFCGTNRQLSRIDSTIENVCPSCGGKNETTSHITRCSEEGRTMMFKKSVAEIVAWLEQKKTDESLTNLIEQYLLGRGKRSMRSVVGADRRFLTLA